MEGNCVDIPEAAFNMVRLVDSEQRAESKLDRGFFAVGYGAVSEKDYCMV